MKSKILIWIIGMILFTTIASATHIPLIHDRLFLMNEANGTIMIDSSLNGVDGQVTNELIWNATSDGKILGALFPDELYFANFTNNCSRIDQNFTFNWQIRYDKDNDGTIFVTADDPAPGANAKFIRLDNPNLFRLALNETITWDIPAISAENYNMFTLRRIINGSNSTIELFINATSQGLRTSTLAQLPSPWNIGGRTSGGVIPLDAKVDILRVVCDSVPNSDIVNWDNNGAGNESLDVLAVDSTPPTIIIISPANNSDTNLDPLIFEWNSTDDSVFDNTCQLTNETTILLEETRPQAEEYFFNFTTTGLTDTRLFNITCFDNSENNNSKTELLTIMIDTINPIITAEFPLNNTFISSQFNNISVDLSCLDLNITSLNYTLFNSSETIKALGNNTNADGGVLTIVDTINTLPLGDGDYFVNVTCLNIVTVDNLLINISLDSSSPIVISTSISAPNGTVGNLIQINGTCNDNNLVNITSQNNETGSFVNVETLITTPNEATFIFNDTIVEGVIGTRFICVDSLNNEVTSGVETYLGIPAPPSITAVTGTLATFNTAGGIVIGIIITLAILVGLIRTIRKGS